MHWINIYEHPLLNQENGKGEMLGGIASQILNRKIIERDKVNFQFEANKREYSGVEKTFDNKEAEKNEVFYSKKQNEKIFEKEKISLIYNKIAYHRDKFNL